MGFLSFLFPTRVKPDDGSAEIMAITRNLVRLQDKYNQENLNHFAISDLILVSKPDRIRTLEALEEKINEVSKLLPIAKQKFDNPSLDEIRHKIILYGIHQSNSQHRANARELMYLCQTLVKLFPDVKKGGSNKNRCAGKFVGALLIFAIIILLLVLINQFADHKDLILDGAIVALGLMYLASQYYSCG